MKNPAVVLSFFFLAVASAAAADSRLSLPPYQRSTLANGLTLLLMEKRDLPLASLRILVKSGSISDSKGKEGLADLTAELLRKGTPSRDADHIAAALDFMGAEISTSARLDYSIVAAEFLSKDLNTGLDILADILRNPSFPQSELEKLVERRIGDLQSDKDDPQAVLDRYFRAYLFQNHPLGRPVGGDETSLASITRGDVVSFHRRRYVPSNVIVAAVGDFETASLKSLLEARFGSWAGEPIPVSNVEPPHPSEGRRLLLVDKPDATQSFFAIGNVGVARADPDRVPILLANTLFGGRFTSLLNSELRIRTGLTYGASSRFEMERIPGAFIISSFTPNESTGRALDLTLEVLNNLHLKGITEAQLESAKSYVKGQYPLDIETADDLARLLAELEFYGLGQDEVSELYARIDATSRDDLQRVIDRHFPLDNLVFTIIGKASEVGDRLSKFATKIDRKAISQPGF